MSITNYSYRAGTLLMVFIVLGLYYEKPRDTGAYDLPTKVTKKDVVSPVVPAQKNYEIAVMVPATNPALEKIVDGFRDEMSMHLQARFTVYNAQSSRALMRAQAEEIVSKNYDLVFTVGAACSLMAQEVTNKKKSDVPIVFTAVHNPSKINLAAQNVTGIAEVRNYEQQRDLLLLLKPDTSTVLLVYDPSQGSGLVEDKVLLEQLFREKNRQLKTVEIDKASSLVSKVAGALAGVDVVLVLKDITVVSGIETLVALCNRARVALYASDLDSGSKGAVLSYGVDEHNFGKAAAQKAREILEHNKLPSELSVTSLDDFYYVVNSSALVAQNLMLDKNILFLMKSGKFL